jgi:RNA polymerase sigma-70 factor (ECF subfamily)
VEGRPLTERELVLRAQRGDERAFEELIRTHEQLSFRLAYLIAGNAADAQDAAQEAAIKAWRALGRFQAGRPLRPWFLQIVANEARNRRRAAGRRAQLALRAERERSSGGAAPSPETILLAGEERHRLLAALDSLPEPARLVLGCRFLLDMSEADTAVALGIRQGTVKSRLARALERLRGIYD